MKRQREHENEEVADELDDHKPFKKKRRTLIGNNVSCLPESLCMTAMPATQLGDMLATALMERLRQLGKIHEELETLKHAIAEFKSIASVWQARCTDLAGSTALPVVLNAIIQVFQCGLPGSDRPHPSSVRDARNILFQNCRASGKVAPLAKAMVVFAQCKPMMEKSKRHAVGGLEDEAATFGYDHASRSFEEKLAIAFDDEDVYFDGDSSRPQLSADMFEKDSAHITTRCAHMISAVKRWSPATLEMKLPFVIADVDNMFELVGGGRAALIRDIGSCNVFKQLNDAFVGPFMTGSFMIDSLS